jgi:hypothetical protein
VVKLLGDADLWSLFNQLIPLIQQLAQIGIAIVRAIIQLAPSVLVFFGKIVGLIIHILLGEVKILLPIVIFLFKIVAIILPPILGVVVKIVSWFLNLFLLAQALGLKLLSVAQQPFAAPTPPPRMTPLDEAPTGDTAFESVFKHAGGVALELWDLPHWQQVFDFNMPLAKALRDHPLSAQMTSPYVAVHGVPFGLDGSAAYYVPRGGGASSSSARPSESMRVSDRHRAAVEYWEMGAAAQGTRRLLEEAVVGGDIARGEADALYAEMREAAMAGETISELAGAAAAARVPTLDERMDASRRFWAHHDRDPHGAFMHALESLLESASRSSPVRAAHRHQVLQNLEAAASGRRKNSTRAAPFSTPFPGAQKAFAAASDASMMMMKRPLCQGGLCGGKGRVMEPVRDSLRESAAKLWHLNAMAAERHERGRTPEEREAGALQADAFMQGLGAATLRGFEILGSPEFEKAARGASASLFGEDFSLHDTVERHYYRYSDGYHWLYDNVGYLSDWGFVRRIKENNPAWRDHGPAQDRLREAVNPETGRRLLFVEMATLDGGLTYVPLNDSVRLDEETGELVGVRGGRVLLANLPLFALFTERDCYHNPKNPLCLIEIPGSWAINKTPSITYPSKKNDDSFCDPYFPCHSPRDLLDWRAYIGGCHILNGIRWYLLMFDLAFGILTEMIQNFMDQYHDIPGIRAVFGWIIILPPGSKPTTALILCLIIHIFDALLLVLLVYSFVTFVWPIIQALYGIVAAGLALAFSLVAAQEARNEAAQARQTALFGKIGRLSTMNPGMRYHGDPNYYDRNPNNGQPLRGAEHQKYAPAFAEDQRHQQHLGENFFDRPKPLPQEHWPLETQNRAMDWQRQGSSQLWQDRMQSIQARIEAELPGDSSSEEGKERERERARRMVASAMSELERDMARREAAKEARAVGQEAAQEEERLLGEFERLLCEAEHVMGPARASVSTKDVEWYERLFHPFMQSYHVSASFLPIAHNN